MLNGLGLKYDAKDKTILIKIGTLEVVKFKLDYGCVYLVSVNELYIDLGLDIHANNNDYAFTLANFCNKLKQIFPKNSSVNIKVGNKYVKCNDWLL